MPVSREKNRSAWFMSATKCPVTGLALSCQETLVPRSTENLLRLEIVKIGDRILLIKGQGYVDSQAESEFVSFVDAFAQRRFPVGEKIIFMEDYAAITGSDSGARKQYIAYFANQKNMLAGIIFNVSSMMKISFNLFKKLHPAGFKAHAAATYAEAMALAMKFLEPEGRLERPESSARVGHGEKAVEKALKPPDLGERISEALETGKKAWMKNSRQGLARRFSDDLIRYISSIDWRAPGVPLPESILDDDVSAAKVFDAISFVKSEIDSLLEERARAEAVLRESEARERLLIQHARAGFMIYDFAGDRIIRVNDSLIQMTGYSEAELLTMTVADLMTEAGRMLFDTRRKDILAGRPVSPNVEYEGRKKNGDIWWCLLNAVISYEGGRAGNANVVVTDITHLKDAENKLLEYQRKLKGLAVRLSMAEEDQRRNMASRLHEIIGQELFVLLLQLDRFEKKLALPDKIPAVHQMRDQVLKIIRETKDLTFDLSPPALYDFGFREALEALSRTVSSRHGISVTTDFKGEMDAIADEIKIIVYRCLKELIHNTVKHARAGNIHIRLENNSAGFQVAYRDDGIGFDADEAAPGPRVREGFGLFDIREKMGHLGGDLVIDSRPGEGVAIRMAIPG